MDPIYISAMPRVQPGCGSGTMTIGRRNSSCSYRPCAFRDLEPPDFLVFFSFFLNKTQHQFVFSIISMLEPLYQCLDQNRDEVRLLFILPEEPENTRLRCQMQTISLLDTRIEDNAFVSNCSTQPKGRMPLAAWINSQREVADQQIAFDERDYPQSPWIQGLCRFNWGDFAALSYTWGDPKQTEAIVVNGHQVQATVNLVHALQTFRKAHLFHGNQYMLWADALCINQDDPHERSSQVKKLRDLYGMSWSTMAFLGPEEEESGQAIQLIKELVNCEKKGTSADLRNKLEADPGFLGDGKWLAFQRFVQRPYWARLWIVQEVALAPSNMLMFAGDDSTTWAEVQDALASIHTCNWYVKDTCLAHDQRNNYKLPLQQGRPSYSRRGWGCPRYNRWNRRLAVNTLPASGLPKRVRIQIIHPPRPPPRSDWRPRWAHGRKACPSGRKRLASPTPPGLV